MGSIRRKGAGYEARYRDPQGRSRSKTLRTKAEARRFLAETESTKNEGTWIDPKRARIKFGLYAEE